MEVLEVLEVLEVVEVSVIIIFAEQNAAAAESQWQNKSIFCLFMLRITIILWSGWYCAAQCTLYDKFVHSDV